MPDRMQKYHFFFPRATFNWSALHRKDADRGKAEPTETSEAVPPCAGVAQASILEAGKRQPNKKSSN